MKTKVKNITSYFFIIVMMFLFAGFTWNKNKHKAQAHQLVLDILSEEKVEVINYDSQIVGEKIIVLDGDGNVMLNRLSSEVENGNLNRDESLILFEADFLMDNQGNRIYIQN